MSRWRKLGIVVIAAAVALALMGGTVLARPVSNPATERIGSTLDGLVERGVITEEQAQAVLDELLPLFEGLGEGKHDRSPGQPKLGLRQIIGGIATVLGIEPQEMLQQLQEGQSLADIIVAQGSSVEAVIEDLSAQLQSKLDQAVADGKITVEQAEQLLASFHARATDLIENADLTKVRRHGAGDKRDQRGDGDAPGNLGPSQIIGGIATVLGIEPQELLQQLREGQSLADIIVAQGSSVEAVIEDLSAQLQSKLDQAVADGRITAEQAEQLLTSFQAQARQELENPGLHRTPGRHAGPAVRGHSPSDNGRQARAPGRGAGVNGQGPPGRPPAHPEGQHPRAGRLGESDPLWAAFRRSPWSGPQHLTGEVS